MSDSAQEIANRNKTIRALENILGKRYVKKSKKTTAFYRQGWRSGNGEALAIIFPQTLVALWHALNVCHQHNCIIIMQAANTGLTEGSTPSGSDYDRPVVVINTLAINTIFSLHDGKQVISLAGATLHQLEQHLAPMGRAPHSVIGSSCLGASIIGGIANNSGGALVKRGPAYTEFALYAQVTTDGKLELVNHLGVTLDGDPEQILQKLENGEFDRFPDISTGQASASDYESRLRDINASTPSRYNADASRLFEASGCAGKLAVLAVRVDTFPLSKREQTFYIGTNEASHFTQLRRDMLMQLNHIPDVAEYMHKKVFRIARQYGKDTFLSVEKLGTKNLPRFFSMKSRIDHILNRQPWLPRNITDRFLQMLASLFPEHLPPRLLHFEQYYEHHLILKVSDEAIEETRKFLTIYFENKHDSYFIECSPLESQKALLHRFAAAGAAIRYQLLNDKTVGELLALDIALPRNEKNWVEKLPSELAESIESAFYYGHFFCQVFHQDYILKKGRDINEVKQQLLQLLDSRAAKYPAEHNVGHLYEAEPQLKSFYQRLDPTNTFNPGIGKTSKHQRNCHCCSY